MGLRSTLLQRRIASRTQTAFGRDWICLGLARLSLGAKLRGALKVQTAGEYFDTIDDEKVPKGMLDLAIHIVDTKRGKFEPKKFQDHYENALK